MKFDDYMKQQGFKEKHILVCPECGEVLNDDEYDEVNAYHNTLDGVCKKCGHTEHYTCFSKYVYVKE